MNTPPNPIQARLRAIFLLVAIVATVLVASLLITHGLDQVQAMLRTAGWIGLVAMVFLYAALGASPVPSELLTVLIIAASGPLAATFVATAGNYLASLIEYSIGTQMGNVAELDRRREKLPWGLGRFPADSVWFLLLGRSLPGPGSKLVSLVSGAYHVRMWRYSWTTILSNTWGAAWFSFGGYQIMKAAWYFIQHIR